MSQQNESQSVWEIDLNRCQVVARRRFMQVSGGLAVTGAMGLTSAIAANAASMKREGKSCILLWMQGGPSQFETWDPKPGHANGGETKSTATNVPGIHIAENLPHLAKSASRLCIVRSMTSKEGSHPRASFLMRTGYLPQASVKYPALGSQVAYHLGDPEFDLPSFVRIGRGTALAKGGFLGVDFDPFLMNSATQKPQNTDPGTDQRRYRKRLDLTRRLERGFAGAGGEALVKSHQKINRQASQMVLSSRMTAFDIEQEPSAMRAAYGDGDAADACLMARRLVEAGVPFVEINVGNWDTHDNNFDRTRELCGRIDQPFAMLLEDLEQRGMLERTMVIWAGEFGRTPRINPRGGRDHYPRAFSSVLAGCGVRGGQVIGMTDRSGSAISDRPVTVPDFFRTVYHGLGIDADHEYVSNIGRPIKVADEGEVVSAVYQ